MKQPSALRRRASELAAPLPPLLADAERLAATVLLGEHGRRHSGVGNEFWQYRPATEGDEARSIDWRRSAKSDVHFIRQKEWQAAQSVLIWVDQAQSMGFASDRNLPEKGARAKVLALAVAILLVRGGERVGLTHSENPPRTGEAQLVRLANELIRETDKDDFGVPEVRGMRPYSRTIFLSDFLGDFGAVETAMGRAADRGVKGAILQILDPQEEAFPFDGRTIFESMGGSVRHETLKASDLRDRYLDRLAARKDALGELARKMGWQYHCHHTNDAAQSPLLWVFSALESRRKC